MPKLNEKLKSLYLGPILGPSSHVKANKKFFGKTHFCRIFVFLDFYCCPEFQKKLINIFREKLVTEEQTKENTDPRTSINS